MFYAILFTANLGIKVLLLLLFKLEFILYILYFIFIQYINILCE